MKNVTLSDTVGAVVEIFPLTNNTEAILEARLLQSKRPSNHTTKGRQGLQGGPNGVRDVADGHIGTAIIYHDI